MNKFIQYIVISIILFFGLLSGVFAGTVRVENVFSDIDENYKYLHELQTLYDKGIITPDAQGKFDPQKLLTREEFVGIVMEVSCQECIKPEVSLDLVQKYGVVKPFYDVATNNNYFYCIADASEKGIVSGYHEGTACENGIQKIGEKPFCPYNTIILEEALAVVLRTSNILSDAQAQKIRDDIFEGRITESLSDDIHPKNPDGSVYSFYPDFQKALDYEVVEYDLEGNRKVSKLIEPVENKLRPKKSITKEDFIRIAAVALKANSCRERQEDNLAVSFTVYDKKCGFDQNNCTTSNLNDITNTYDYKANYIGSCETGVKEPQGYIWRFINTQTGEEIKKYGQYLDNYTFLYPGNWRVYLRIVDNCGNTGEIYKTIGVSGDIQGIYDAQERLKNTAGSIDGNYTAPGVVFDDGNDVDGNTDLNNGGNNDNTGYFQALSVSIEADPVIGNGPLKSSFDALIHGGEGPYEYEWSFSDGGYSYSDEVSHVFMSAGSYIVELLVTDSNGQEGRSQVVIVVQEGSGEVNFGDSDNDGVSDNIDRCPLLTGVSENMGCPILETKCYTEENCKTGYYCDTSGEVGVCLPQKIEESCLYKGRSTVFGNAICNSCPCEISLDFNATLRECDVVFPAITSPDGSVFYSKGDFIRIDE